LLLVTWAHNAYRSFVFSWIFIFSRQVIEFSRKRPLVSGYYKLLHMVMQICDRFHYFAPLLAPVAQASSGNEDVPMLESGAEADRAETLDNRRFCFALVSQFIKDLILYSQQFRDELLVAVLQLVGSQFALLAIVKFNFLVIVPSAASGTGGYPDACATSQTRV